MVFDVKNVIWDDENKELTQLTSFRNNWKYAAERFPFFVLLLLKLKYLCKY